MLLQRTVVTVNVVTLKTLIVVKKKVKVCFYIAQYPVRWTAQSALHFLPSLTDLFIPTPTELGFSGKHSSDAAITSQD